MKKILLMLLIVAIFVSMTGCWNMRELNELGVAVAAGIDITEDDLLELTVQVVVPRRLAQEGYEGNAVMTYTTTGRTVFEALRKLTAIASRKIYIGHIQLLVIGEGFARKGIMDAIDFFERDHEFRRQAYIIVTNGLTAKEVVEAGSIIELIPAIHLTKAIDNAIYTGATRKVSLIQLFKETNKVGHHLVLPTIHQRFEADPKHAKDLRVTGTAVFKNDMLVSYLDEFETRGYLWITNELEGGILVLPSPTSKEELISLEIMKAEGKMRIKKENDQLYLMVEANVNCNIGEQQTPTTLTSMEMIDYLINTSREVIKAEITSAFKKAQDELQLDIFGYGDLLKKHYPELWMVHQEDWDSVFSSLPIQIDVDSKIRRSGQLLQPTLPK